MCSCTYVPVLRPRSSRTFKAYTGIGLNTLLQQNIRCKKPYIRQINANYNVLKRNIISKEMTNKKQKSTEIKLCIQHFNSKILLSAFKMLPRTAHPCFGNMFNFIDKSRRYMDVWFQNLIIESMVEHFTRDPGGTDRTVQVSHFWFQKMLVYFLL